MSQLKLYKTLTEPCEFPSDLKGFEYRSYNGTVEDRAAWAEICKNGLVGDDADATRFVEVIEGADGYKPENVFFITENGTPVATITALVQENGRGWVHMVSVRKESRGKGLGAYLNQIALAALSKAGCTYVGLTTDEFRVPAVKSYLNVYKTNAVNVKLNQINYVPDSQGRRNETSISLRSGNNKGNNSICFIDNKGILYCVPQLCTNENTVECFRNIKDFEIRLYLDKKLGKDGETVNIGLDRTLFINVSRTGKVTVPGITMGKEVNCGLSAHQKGYYQCSLSTMIESM